LVDTLAVDDRRRGPRNGGDHEVRVGERDARTVARYFAREREKQEVRRERDVVMLGIARNLGEGALAERLDVRPAVVDRMLASARERLDVPTITIRRVSASRDRWADVDTYYEALGSRPRISPRRPIPREF
jgi:hypothetical protein